jgi:hypothetical protein
VKKILLIVIFAIILKPILPVIDYIVNYEYISTVLCENKVKPELKCNGKCHLMKELAKASENEKPINSDKKDNSKQEVEVLFFQEIITQNFNINLGRNKSLINANYSDGYSYLISKTFFHPPTFIS